METCPEVLATGLSSSLGKGARPADKRGSLGPRVTRTSLTGSGNTVVEGAETDPPVALAVEREYNIWSNRSDNNSTILL